MPSSFTPLLKLELPATGELSGTWGTTVNNAITTPLSEAIAGTTTITVGGSDYTLSNGDGSAANEARKMFIVATGTPGASRNVICPAASKFYVFRNDTNQTLTLKTLSGTGIAVPAGQYRFLYCDGTNVVETFNAMASLTLGTALAAASGGTGQSSYTTGDLLYATGTTALSKLGIGAANRVLTSSGTAPQWVTSLSGLTGVSSSSITNTSLTSGRLVYSTTGGAQTDSANLTFNGTTLVANDFTDSSLTATRVVYAGAGGNLVDSASLAFDGSSLLVGATTGGTNLRITSSSDGNNGLLRFFDQGGTRRLDVYAAGSAAAYVSTGGNVPLVFAINDVEQMRLNSSTLTLVANPTLSAGTANGVLYLNGSKVATSGSALTFDGTTLTLSSSPTLSGGTVNTIPYLNASKSLVSGAELGFNGSQMDIGVGVYYGRLNVGRDSSAPYATLMMGDQVTPTNTVGMYMRQTSGAAGISTAGADFAFFLGGPGVSEGMRLTSTGLGIGTTPISKLQSLTAVSALTSNAGFSSLPLTLSDSTALAADTGGGINFNAIISSGGSYNSIAAIKAGRTVATGADYRGYLAFYTGDNGVGYPLERMRLDTAGNLGVGTSSPIYQFHVVGSSPDIVSQNTGANNTRVAITASNTAAYISTTYSSSAVPLIFNYGGIGSAGVELMRLDSSGNLGLGVTPSAAWGTANSQRALQVGPVGALSSLDASVGNKQVNLSNNVIDFNAPSTYLTSDSATAYRQINGAHLWLTAPSGTAGNVISFTQAMTLDASGNLGVGVTNPAAKLEVYGGASGTVTNIQVGNAATGFVFGIDSSNNCQIRTAQSVAILFYTASIQRASIPAAGGMVVGTAALATTATDGFLYVPTCAGTPTGTPTTQTGTAPIVVDTTNNKLYFYSGGQWRDAGP